MLKYIFITCCFLTACNFSEDSKVSGNTPQSVPEAEPPATPSPSPSPTPAAPTWVDVRAIVSTGENLSFNNQTGGPHDLALNPVTGLPAVAYYDKSASAGGSGATPAVGALKYAWMDALGNWNVEAVDFNYGTAVCGNVNSVCVGAPNTATAGQLNQGKILRLAFKANGTPVISYVYGSSQNTTLLPGSGTKDIRLAERSAAGVWSVTTAFQAPVEAGATNVAIATIDPMKALTLVLDDEDRPHITFSFFTQTSTNSQVKYLFRSSAGVWSSMNVAPLVALAGTVTAANQAGISSGLALCPVNGAPILGFTTTTGAAGTLNNPSIARCTGLDADGKCLAFEVVNLLRGCTGSATCISGLVNTNHNGGTHLDLKVEPVTNRPVLAFYSVGNPNTTGLHIRGPVACDQVQSGAANSWGAATTIAAASAGASGVSLAVKGVTDYLVSLGVATTSVAMSKFNGTAWFAAVHGIETTTVAQEGVSLAYDGQSDTAYTSYAQLPAAAGGAVGNDLKVAQIDPDELVTAGAAGSFVISVVDNRGNVFPNTASFPVLSAATAPNGRVGYAYYFYDNNNTHASSKLYFGMRGGTFVEPYFSERFVTSYQQSASATAAVGNMPALAFDSNSNPLIAAYNGVAAEQNLILARSSDRGVSFSITVVDDSVANVGQYPSVALSGDAIGISYYDVTNTALRFARWTAQSGWKRFVVDGAAGSGSCGNAAADAGKFAKLQFTSDGRPAIVYQYDTGVRVAYATEALTSGSYVWNCVALESSASSLGAGLDFKLDSQNRPFVVYVDTTAGSVRYASCASAVETCVTTGTSAFTAGVVEVTGVTSLLGEAAPSLRIGSDGAKYVAFHNSVSKALRLGTWAAGSSSFAFESIEQSVLSAPSFVGQYGALLLNSYDRPTVFYRSSENWLRYYSREQE
ncbi:esterase [Bdellovibrio bacteriovorus]|uniref:esterase n=1 Tax=Bdellovibrio bacteriovorus TaxID=959 RepID=UPI003AA86355